MEWCSKWKIAAAAASNSLQSCPTLCDPMEGSPQGSPGPGILQARTLEWVAISFSNAWKWKVKVKSLSRVRPSATPWTAAFQAPPSMGFSRQEYWRGVPLPSPMFSWLMTKSRPALCFVFSSWRKWNLWWENHYTKSQMFQFLITKLPENTWDHFVICGHMQELETMQFLNHLLWKA